MTSPNKFTIDVTAKDLTSSTLTAVNKAVAALKTSLEGTAGAYERVLQAQNKLGVSKGRGGADSNAALNRQLNEVVRNQERATQAGQRREQAIVAAAQREEAAMARAIQTQQRSVAANARIESQFVSSSNRKVQAYDQEIRRSEALVHQYQREAAAAQARYGTARSAAAANPTGLTDQRAASTAAAQLATALGRVRQAEADLAAATRGRAAAQTAANREQEAASRAAERLAAAQERTAASTNSLRYALYQTAGAYGAISKSLLGAVSSVSQAAIAYEAAFAQVARTTDLGILARGVGAGAQEASNQLQVLREDLLAMSTDIPVAFENLSSVASLGAQLGIASSDVANFTEVVAKFTAQTNVTAEQTATYFGRLQNILDVPTSKFQNLGSAVSQLGTDSVATESEILAVTTQIGAMANNAGFSAQYVVGLGTALASLRVPPELARGTTTRVFQLISRAVADSGEDLAAWGKVLGVTAMEAKELWQSNPEQFFNKFIGGLGAANDAGMSLIPMLDSLGIKAARDVPVITRLANSYELLGTYVSTSYQAFAEGTYLDESFMTIAQTAQASLTKMVNSFNNLKAAIGDTFLPVIKVAADALNALFEGLSNLIPSGASGAVLGIVAVVGIMFAFRAAMALTVGVLFAMQTAMKGLGIESLRLGPVLGVIRQQNITLAGSSNAATGALTRQAGAHRLAATTGSQLVMVNGALVASTGAAAGAGLGFAAAMSKLGKFIGPAGFIALGLGAVIGLVSGFASSADDAQVEATRLAEAQKALNQSWIDAGGGADSLTEAINKDTAAFERSGLAMENVSGFFRMYKTETTETADGTQTLTTVTDKLGNSLGAIAPVTGRSVDGFLKFSSAVAEATDTQNPLADNVKETNRALGEQIVILGDATNAWLKKAKFEKIMSAFNTPELQAALRALKDNLGEVDFNNFIQAPDPAKIAAKIKALSEPIQREIAELARETGEKQTELQMAQVNADSTDGIEEQIAAMDRRRESLLLQIEAFNLLGTQGKQAMDALNAAVSQTSTEQILKEALIWDDGVEGAEKIEGALKGTEDTAKSMADALSDAASAFDDMYASALQLTNFDAAMSEAFENLGTSLVENGKRFDTFSEKGRANIDSLTGVLDIYAKDQSAQVANATISAEQAALNMQTFIRSLLDSLTSEGVDVSQLDWLSRYAASLTAQPYVMQMQADTSAAINSLGALNSYAMQVRANMNSFWGGAGGAVSKWKPSNFSKLNAPAPKNPFQGSMNTGRATAEAEKAAEAAKKLAAEQDAAGKAGKAAGNAAKDAADAAAEAIENEKKYVEELASAFSSLTSDAFSLVEAEGAVFDSLQKLGNGFLDNGLELNNVSEAGRANLKNLTDAFEAYGKVVAEQVGSGALDKAQGLQKMAEYASGVRSELVALGVPLAAVDGFLKQLGASTKGWTGTSEDVKQFAGFIEANADALRRAAEQAKLNEEYIKDLSAAYKELTGNLFQGVNDEAGVFEALQKLGIAIEENGTKFNTVTQKGRANYGALEDALDSYGELLSNKIAAGELSAADAGAKFRSFASGIYQELIALGVSASEIQGFFAGIGIDPKGFGNGGKDVIQYTGYIRTANGEMVKLRDSTDDAKQAAEEYGRVMREVFDKQFGLRTAVDSVQSAMNSLIKGYRASIEAVQELRRENKSLDADISGAGGEKRRAEIEAAISRKYGETDRANEYDSQAATAAATIAELKAKQKANNAEIKSLEKGRTALAGQSDEAIANREALQGLTSEMLDQVEAYAATGKSQAEVIKYTELLKRQFVDTATRAGFTNAQLKTYTTTFDNYVVAIKKVPPKTTTTATADVSAATKALNSIPKGGTYETDVKTKFGTVTNVKNTLAGLPKKGDYTVEAKLKRDQLDKDVAKLPTSRSLTTNATLNVSAATKKSLDALSATKPMTIKPQVDQGSYNAAKSTLDNLTAPGDKPVTVKITNGTNVGRAGSGSISFQFAEGGVIPKFAAGGRVPGPTPSNLKQDNVLGMVRGKHPVALQGGEGIINNTAMRMPGVPEWVDQINNGMKGYYAGGDLGGSRRTGGQGGTAMLEASPALIREFRELAAAVNVKLYTGDGRLLADNVNNGNAAINRSGRG